MPETAVKVSNNYYQALKKVADDLGMSVREVTDKVISEGLGTFRDFGKKISTDGDLLAKIQKELDQVKDANLNLQTRFDDLEAELEDAGPGPTTLTKEDLIGQKRAIKPGKREEDGEEEDGEVYFCKECANAGRETVLDRDKDTEVCPVCGRKINWEGEGGMGGVGWAIAGLAAALLLTGTKRSY